MANNIKGITVEIGGNTTKLQSAIADAEKKSKDLNSELRDVDKLLKFNPDNAELLAQRQKILAEQVETTAEKLKTLKEAEEQVTESFKKGEASEEQVRAIQRAVIETESKLNHYESQVDDTSKSVDNLGDESKGTSKEVDNFGNKAKSNSSKLESLKKAAKAVAVGIGAMATATVAAGKGVFDLAKGAAESGDEIDKQSQKIGISAETYQELAYAAKLSGTNMAVMQNAQKKLTAQGIDLPLVDALKQVAESEDVTAAATEMFGGKIAQELMPMLNQGADGIDAMMNKADELGLVMNDKNVKAAASFNDSLTTLQDSFSATKNRIMSDMLPGLTSIMDGLTGVITGQEGASEALKTGASEVVASMATMIPELLNVLTTLIASLAETAPEIVNSLVTGITDNLPSILDSAVLIITAIVDGLLRSDCIISLINTALTLIVTLANGLVAALPKMIPEIVKIVGQVTTTLIDNLPMLIDCALQLIIALATGLVDAIPTLVTYVPQIITGIVNGLSAGLGSLMSVGKDLIEGLWSGINDKIAWIKEKITGFGSQVLDTIKGIFGIHSPSKVFRDTIGKNLMLGLAEGIDENASKAIDSMDTVAEDIAGTEFDGMNIERSINTTYTNTANNQMGVYAGSIGNKLDVILEAIREGKVLKLDGDKIVGGTINRIDNQLGTIGNLKRRGAF